MRPRFLKLSAFLCVFTSVALSAGCASRNIHKELVQDPKILTRGWTYGSHGAFNAGDRGFEYSSPALYENTIVFGSEGSGLVALYPGLLKVRWKFTVQGGVLSDVLVDKKSVYFAGADGFLYALSAETGKQAWKYELKSSFASRPTIAQGKLFITTPDDVVRALDAGSGKQLWTYKRRTPQSATIHAASSPLVDQGEVIVGMTDGFIVSLSAEDGKLKWERKLTTSTKFSDVDATPVLGKDAIYVPAYDGSLFALKRKSGDVLWKFEAGGAKNVFLEADRIYLPSSDGNIYAISSVNAKLLWKFEVDRGSPTAVARGKRYLFVASSHQYLYAIDSETGKGAYRYNVGDGSGFSAAPLFDPATRSLYALSMSGNLYQFKANEGELKNDGYVFDVLNRGK